MPEANPIVLAPSFIEFIIPKMKTNIRYAIKAIHPRILVRYTGSQEYLG